MQNSQEILLKPKKRFGFTRDVVKLLLKRNII